jgi:predicted component of viral defense system (DUF524 family)
MTYFPSNSPVLIKKTGYREILQIYRLLHLSFIPKMYQDLDHTLNIAFSLKDFTILWEYYVLVELIKELKSYFGGFKININFEEKTYEKTKYEYAEFEFNKGLKLYYQKSITSYSGFEYRPDFYIEYNSKKFIFDAKFRFFENNSEERKKEIINNMHYYRDALGATFAVAVCLAEDKKKECIFWSLNKNFATQNNINSLSELINNCNKGIGIYKLPLPEIVQNKINQIRGG